MGRDALSMPIGRVCQPRLKAASVGGLLMTLTWNCSTVYVMCIAANSEDFQDGTWDERHGYRILARIQFAPKV
jgi:hypothetical protein